MCCVEKVRNFVLLIYFGTCRAVMLLSIHLVYPASRLILLLVIVNNFIIALVNFALSADVSA
jgi:hypothetical protein